MYDSLYAFAVFVGLIGRTKKGILSPTLPDLDGAVFASRDDLSCGEGSESVDELGVSFQVHDVVAVESPQLDGAVVRR